MPMTLSNIPVYCLLVDDLSENLLALEALLRRDNLVLLKAQSGPEALELLLKHDVALALLDVQMPGMNGFELAELMRGTERTRSVPIIFLTAASADQQRRFRGYEAGAVDFLYKPIEPHILKSKAEIFFELYRQRHEVARHRDDLQTATRRISQLLEESRQYASALEEADCRKDEFLAMLAHELRNPLAPIRNGVQILRMNPPEEMAAKVRDMMERQVTHMVRLIDDLMDVSRVSQGKIELKRERITLQSVVESAVETSLPLIEAGEHQLQLNLPETPIWLEADLTRLAQVVSNLLNNAAKYTQTGGAITLTARQDERMAELEVADNGMGIPPDMLEGIFELFTQVEHTLQQSQGGLGIGLSLVKRLISLHGGSIRAESEGIDKGSRFSLRLPLAEQTDIHTRQTAADASGNTASLNVLVVDDNIPSARTAGWMLEMIGHHATLVHGGREALDKARELQPDVVVLDIGLPDINGYDICRELRQDPAFKQTVFIAQTGWGQAKDREMAKEAGFDHHLVKPLNFETFSQLLTDIRKAA